MSVLTNLGAATWQDRLAVILETMRELSRQTDPDSMIRVYGAQMSRLLPVDRRVSLSRRGLEAPWFRVTRSTTWKTRINPWKEVDRLPLLRGGLLAELLYSDEPRIIDDLHVPPDDPAAEFLEGQRSLVAIPLYDRGAALNMVVLMQREPAAFDREHFPELVWLSSLFGRAIHNLALSEEVQQAYRTLDEELRVVGDIQRSLLPRELPRIPGLDLAASYQTARRAGGDYYDFFELPGGRWGILIADVSGHGTPAAVLMAITHAIAHTQPDPTPSPGRTLAYVNRHLFEHYTGHSGTFVTAFYGVYDPARRELTYARAGHNPPRLKRCQDSSLASLNGLTGLPLGVSPAESFPESTMTLIPGDQLIFYTDGVTEARNPAGEMFGLPRLDEILADCTLVAAELLKAALAAVDQFAASRPPDDDRTLLVARVS